MLRKIECFLSWVLSNSLSVDFCLESLDLAFNIAKPEINNSDQAREASLPRKNMWKKSSWLM